MKDARNDFAAGGGGSDLLFAAASLCSVYRFRSCRTDR
jgi:hypothetical protein